MIAAFMKTLLDHARAATVLLFSVALLIVMSIFLLQRLQTLNEGGFWVAHSQRVRFELAQVLQSMTDLGSGPNAYIVSHDPDVFSPARRAESALPSELKALEEIVGDSEVERPLFDALVLLANRRMVETSELRERARAGDVAAVTRALTDGQARSLMVAARSMVAQLETEEENALAGHRRAQSEAYRDAVATVESTSVVAAVLLVVVTVVTLREGERVRMIQEELATTLRSIGDGVISTDSSGTVRFMNEIAQRLTGYSDQEAHARPLTEIFRIVSEDTHAEVESPVAKVLREGNVVSLGNHTLLIARDGSELPIEDSGAPIRDGAGKLSGVVLVFRDATAERLAKAELQARERQFVAFADAMPQLAWMERTDGSHDYFNRGWYVYTGLAAGEGLQRDAWTTVIHPDDVQRGATEWATSRTRGTRYEIELRLRRYDGVYRWFLVRAVPDLDASGFIIQWVGTCTDIDQAKQTQAALRETEAALRAADARKDKFLATLSHELRNPLAPIRTATRVLTAADVTPENRTQSIAIIARQVGHMASLLDDLMDVARITRGVLILKPAITSIRTIIEMAIESTGPALDEKQHRLTIELPAAAVSLNVDSVRLTQVVTNLLTNAAKYTDNGGLITVGARFDGEDVVIYVRDTGIGISASMLNHVFEMFAQVQSATERSAGGLGIGLGLAKALVELQGGRMRVASAGLGHGSEFSVTLPSQLVSRESHTAPEADHSHRGGMLGDVLIADDNRDAVEILGMLLETSGHKVSVAYNGVDAVEIAKSLRPGIIVLDIGMPGLNGYEVARQIRREPWAQQATLIAVTGWGQEDDKQKAAEAGFNHHLTKPVDPDVLERLIAAS